MNEKPLVEFHIEEKRKLGVMLVVSGPSGAGKSTICKKVIKDNNLYFSISCTTRSPRPGEKDGVDYYFISKNEFTHKIKTNDFIEYATVHGNYYGTIKSKIIDLLSAGKSVILDIDVQGALKIKESIINDPLLNKCAEFLFIAPPSYSELERRLRGRGTENEKNIQKRLNNAKNELAYCFQYEYLLVNDEVESAINEMNAIFVSLTKKSKRYLRDNQ